MSENSGMTDNDDDVYVVPKVSNAPELIWLNYGELDEDCDHSACHEVTWEAEPIGESDVRYVRADLHEALIAERDALRQGLVHKDMGHLDGPVETCPMCRVKADRDRLAAEVLRLQAERDAMAKELPPAIALLKAFQTRLGASRFKSEDGMAWDAIERITAAFRAALSPATSTGSEVGK